jgi:hypothetical protein
MITAAMGHPIMHAINLSLSDSDSDMFSVPLQTTGNHPNIVKFRA